MIHTSASGDCDHNEWKKTSSTTPHHHHHHSISLQASGDVHDATRALQNLDILQPRPVAHDDGGNYPPPLQFNACFPVGTATASAHGPLDPVLVAGLENARERMTLLKFEDQIVRFLKNPREPQLHFPPLSSYHRLIVHRLAQRCGLEHQTADYNSFENGSARVVTLFKTMQSAVPRILLIDLSVDRQTPTVTPAHAPKIMMRRRSALIPGANGSRNNGMDKATPSLQDRERAYAEARARIFGEDNSSNSSTAVESGSLSSPCSTTSLVHDSTDIVVSTENNDTRHESVQAPGPDRDSSKGFDRGGALSCGNSGVQTQDLHLPKEHASHNEIDKCSRASQPSATNAASWKESKVLWRNREQELNDPDFTRNHDAFRLRSSGETPSGSGSGGESPYHSNRFGMRFGHGDFHDRSYDRPYGFQYQQTGSAPLPQPPPLPMSMVSPGRGRLHVGEPDYNNRVDAKLCQRSPHQQYHAQQQFQQHQSNLPPSMIMGRGGYGYPSPQGRPFARQGNWVPPHASTRAVGNSGFIADEFPPLGK
ncbi:unnamed protein product [Peronospora belbahrii]|uniref:R3H domain-containing protein n=1 Tax=Peronospora belbahrii TaxID=622444 RepID=A0AAU9KMP5_9STRA|nr:unnamed protein product [Peronospora belbahrii]